VGDELGIFEQLVRLRAYDARSLRDKWHMRLVSIELARSV
jgi:hypothetical protein